jgi:hypothetical protein
MTTMIINLMRVQKEKKLSSDDVSDSEEVPRDKSGT